MYIRHGRYANNNVSFDKRSNKTIKNILDTEKDTQSLINKNRNCSSY